MLIINPVKVVYRATAIPELIEDKAIFKFSGLVLFKSAIGFNIRIKPIIVPNKPNFNATSEAITP